MRREGFYATRFSLSVRVIDGPRWGMEAHLPPSQDNFVFLDALEELWERMMEDVASNSRFKKLSVTLYGLSKTEDINTDLFIKPTLQSKRNETLSNMMDELNEKYGAETIRLGVSPKTRAGFVGTKIAFSRVPDLAEFQE